MQVSRTAVYARRTARAGTRAVWDAELTGQIIKVHARSRGTYGTPRLRSVLKREGAVCGRRRRRRHVTTVPDPRAATRPDLVLRQFGLDPAGVETRWCGDITYVPTEEG